MRIIYVFRRVRINEVYGFGFRLDTDEETTNSWGYMKDLAQNVKKEIKRLLQTEKLVVIRFKAEYDIECRKDQSPFRCLPLSEIDQYEFWKCFKEETE